MATLTVTNFQEQYEYAKNATLNAIEAQQNVVLWGEGANGKTHLVNEIKSYIENNDYQQIHEPSMNDDKHISNILSCCNKNKFIMPINNIEYIKYSLKNYPFVFINMNDFKYPKYSKLRSGKVID